MKRDLGDNVVDRFVISDECYDQDKEIFNRAFEDLKARVKLVNDQVEDLSLRFSEAYISDEEPMDVSEDDERDHLFQNEITAIESLGSGLGVVILGNFALVMGCPDSRLVPSLLYFIKASSEFIFIVSGVVVGNSSRRYAEFRGDDNL
ncbi:hypothetical protein LWI28_028673 [Acer negundo]|uniref:Uncharacterized protein n=1 Tax=Acer negundo TaxID=4023 RepID=A0AAD5P6M3_ACENE|nr:hypothetical protein LWI28_028673 [Acer negundo]